MMIPKKTLYSRNRGVRFQRLILFLSCLIPFTAQCQITQADSVTLYTDTQLDSLLTTPVSPERIWRLLGRSKENAPYVVVIRSKPGDVEIHEQWDDVAIIRSGHGILRTGYKVIGQKESGKAPSREWIGGMIQDAKERNFSPGDFIIIPAMLAHQYIPNPGDTMSYFTIKVRRPKL